MRRIVDHDRPGLERFERQPFEELDVVVAGPAPFVVVVGDHQGVRIGPVGAGPGAARSWLDHAATIARLLAGYAVAMRLRCYLGHGASGTSASMAPFVSGLRARGVTATAIDLPKRKAEDALPAFHLVVPSAADVAVGGHSYGGRVASLAAAEPDAPYAALVLFSYPLHPPGAPERTEARIAHWPAIRCPVLLLSGEADPFAKIDLLRTSVAKLPNAELVTYPRLGHTLKPVLEDVLDRTAAFLLSVSAD